LNFDVLAYFLNYSLTQICCRQIVKETAGQVDAHVDVETTKKVMVKALKKPAAVAKAGNKANSAKKNSDLPEVNNKTSTSAACPVVTVCDKLTEDVIKEHNSQNGSLGRGSGSSFTNLTKMYIVKWTMENVLSDERPFEEGQIPIEKFGVKILDQPQYLKNEKNKGKSFKQPETSTITDESKKPGIKIHLSSVAFLRVIEF